MHVRRQAGLKKIGILFNDNYDNILIDRIYKKMTVRSWLTITFDCVVRNCVKRSGYVHLFPLYLNGHNVSFSVWKVEFACKWNIKGYTYNNKITTHCTNFVQNKN